MSSAETLSATNTSLVRREIEASDALTIDQAGDRLGVSKTSVQRMIGRKLLAATQVIRYAPWEICPEALYSAQVRTHSSVSFPS
jgi:hypothetical protein